jgi:uncharacterized membrane protein
MSSNRTDDAVAEYLREVEQRLGDLPMLERRELLADLRAHIVTERAERGAGSEGEVLDILHRLGSPDEVAAAAYAEGGPRPTTIRPAGVGLPTKPRMLLGAALALVVLVVVLVFAACLGVGRVDSTSVPAPGVGNSQGG